MKTVVKTELMAHPMEDVLDIEPCTTITEYREVEPEEVVASPLYDDKDMEIEEKLEEIYTSAMGTVNVTADQIEVVEGKYKARLSEVTATMLNVALAAVREKRELKQHKDKIGIAPAAGKTVTNNNLVVADRNEIIRLLRDKS